MATHEILSPSSSSRWMTCTKSPSFIESVNLPEEPAGYPASEGTIAHEVRETAINEGVHPSTLIGKTFRAGDVAIVVNQAMADYVAVDTDYINAYIKTHKKDNVILLVETRADLTHLKIKGMGGGTADSVIINFTKKTIEVIDFKYGKHVVNVVSNSQLLMYAAGIMKHVFKQYPASDFKKWKAKITITQPRAFHPDGHIRSHTVSFSHLKQWVKRVLVPAGKACNSNQGVFAPSDSTCKWCPAKSHCPALKEYVSDSAGIDFFELADSVPEIESLTKKERANIASVAPLAIAFINSVAERVKQDIIGGDPGYDKKLKVVRGQSRRKFTALASDPEFSELLDYLEPDDIVKTSPRPLGEVETLLKNKVGKRYAAKVMDRVTEKNSTSLLLVSIDDPRKAAILSAVVDFENYKN